MRGQIIRSFRIFRVGQLATYLGANLEMGHVLIEALRSSTAVENFSLVKQRSFSILTLQELRVNMGIILHDEIVKIPDMERMLSHNSGALFRNVLISWKSMSPSRFQEISQVLCFVDTNTHKSRNEPGYDALQVIRWLCDDVKTKWRRLYTIRRISLDKIMVPCKGWVAFRQYFPNKPTKYGVKFGVCVRLTLDLFLVQFS